MKTLEIFISVAKRSPEIEITDEYRASVADAEHAGHTLARYLRIDADGKPVYADGVEVVSAEVDRASERLERVKTDIREYLALVGEFDSVQAMVEKLARLRRTVDNLNHDVSGLTKQAVNRGVERPQDDPAVMAAADKRDRVVAETKDEIQDLSERIRKAQEITRRY
jgi:hypothetical protein